MSQLVRGLVCAIAVATFAGCALSSWSIPLPGRTASLGSDWTVYGGPGGRHFSPLTQIDRRNVQSLKPAWRFDFHEAGDSQTQPLIINGMLYGYTPTLKLIALDARDGHLAWTFDSGIKGSGPQRGVAYWSDGTRSRLLASVMNYLYAIDPRTGAPIADFGDHGRVDLRQNLIGEPGGHNVSLTSPGVVYKDLIIVGFRTSETHPAPPGYIRAYDVRTGQLRWTFHTIPLPAEAGYDTWPPDAWQHAGAANNWAGMVMDEARGIIYVPTGSAVSDFYGADRLGNDLYANCLLALDAATGKLLWHFQTTHHDIWDRDLPSPPVLFTLHRGGARIDAVAQATKQGYVYVFDRVTGKPLYPVSEHPFLPSDVPGEVASPTQPLPEWPAPFARQRLTADLLTQRTPAAHDWAIEQFRTFRSEGQFVPLSVDRPTVIFPGFDGGAEWGGQALDPLTNVLYINSNDVAWTGALTLNTRTGGGGSDVYAANCSSCHGPGRAGSPPAFPSLLGIGSRLSEAQIRKVIAEGGGRMPPFASLAPSSVDALVKFLISGTETSGNKQEMSAPLQLEAPLEKYRFTGYKKFLDPDGYPAVAPPWGTLNALDLNTGKYLWQIPLGEYPALVAQGLNNTGSENYGGPLLTASGVLFIGATIYDHKLRAFDSRTGKLLWQAELPYAGVATPATYMVDGKQYIVICTSNARDHKSEQGSAYVAYALP